MNTDLHGFFRQDNRIYTDLFYRRERRGRRGVLGSFVFSASTAFKASFVAETYLCSQGHQNGLFIKLTKRGI